MRQAVGVFAAGLVCVLGAGCAGNGESTAATSGAATTRPATGRTVGVSPGEAKALSRSMLLRLSDLPAGWTSKPSSEDETCAGIEDLTDRYDVLANVKSDDFSTGGGKQVSASAGIFTHESDAVDALEYLETSIQSDRFRECLDDGIRKEGDEDVNFGDARIRRASFPALGDGSSAWEVVVPFEAKGTYATAFLDVVFIQRGNTRAMVFFANVNSSLEPAMRKSLARLVESRMDRSDARLR